MKKKKKWLDIALDILLVIGIILCVFSIVFKTTFIKIVVNGSSMNPKIEDGDKGYMVKVTKKTKIERFDVVAGKYGTGDDYYIIKRVLGLPGEQIKILDNKLYVNEIEVEQTFSFVERTYNFATTSWTLGENEYLLVGDNRAGTIPPVVENLENIVAKNGFSYARYDITSTSCKNYEDYSSCPIKERNWYWLKEGK